jgi:hypothetical protein
VIADEPSCSSITASTADLRRLGGIVSCVSGICGLEMGDERSVVV